MKDKPLAVQIWLMFLVVIIITSIVLGGVFFKTLTRFFTKEAYETIEEAQQTLILRSKYKTEIKNKQMKNIQELEDVQEIQQMRSVNHIVVIGNKIVKSDNQTRQLKKISPEILQKIKKQARLQKQDRKRYVREIENSKIFYVIYKKVDGRKEAYFVSYMWDTYTNKLIKTLFSQIMIGTFFAFILSLVVALIISRYLTRPLVLLEKNVRRIAKRDWNGPIEIHRNDEIGMLGKSIEYMRNELVNQDTNQQSLLQHISHELKTPIMIIRSYAQSILDEIYPQGDIKKTVGVISKESELLEKKVLDLLYLTKLEYLSKHKNDYEIINVRDIIESAVNRFRYQREDLNWSLSLDDVKINASEEQLNAIIENILSNSIRYAQSIIEINLSKRDNFASIKLFNDGEKIEDDKIDKIFNVFEKGKSGRTGLGLAIVKRILELYGGNIFVKNEKKGVTFIINIPIDIID